MIGLRAAAVVTCSGAPDDGAPGWVVLDGGHVVAVGPEPPPGVDRTDLGDVWLWPGLVDLHADSLGRFECPRPGTRIPLDVAVHDFAVDAVTHGVTRPHLCVSVGEGPDPAAGLARVRDVARTVDAVAAALPAPLPIHLRVDVGAERGVADARTAVDEFPGRIALMSAMDHTPGRGQYRDVETWRPAMRARTGADDRALDRWLSWLPTDPAVVQERRHAVAALARDHGLPFASHDDCSATAARHAADAGATICEFPLTLDAAAAAHDGGMTVVMGAPNAWRGRSHLTGPSARDALRAGALDALTSDYHTGAMIRSVLALVADEVCSLPAAVGLVTTGPAAATAHPGGLYPGAPADLVAVRPGPVPVAVACWVAGRQVTCRWWPSPR